MLVCILEKRHPGFESLAFPNNNLSVCMDANTTLDNADMKSLCMYTVVQFCKGMFVCVSSSQSVADTEEGSLLNVSQ